MSCMMTETKELTILAAYVKEILEGADKMGTIEGVKRISPPDTLKEALKECRIAKGLWDFGRIYERLYRFNEAAYCGHYGHELAKVVPPYSAQAASIDTDDETIDVWSVRLWNLMRFFNYQCTEDATYGTELYKALDGLQGSIAYLIAANAAKKLGCYWGVFGK